mmetsp:Transcript_31629/g.69296  ORF Transcript_31629/g.69296 Transcript_31629/m.69296 type:complete len:355 (+) Transcript_31629:34-1098(+)
MGGDSAAMATHSAVKSDGFGNLTALNDAGQADNGTQFDRLFSFNDEPGRTGLTFDKWPFRLDIDTQFQDWILVGMSVAVVMLWMLPVLAGQCRDVRLCSSFQKWTHMHSQTWMCLITLLNLVVIFNTVNVLPDWTMDSYIRYCFRFFWWWVEHLPKFLISFAILLVLYILWMFKDRVVTALGIDYLTFVRFPSFTDILTLKPIRSKYSTVPVELLIWKVDEVQAASWVGVNSVFVEAHLGLNQPVSTRIYHNLGNKGELKATLQLNLDLTEKAQLWIIVKAAAFPASQEIARLEKPIEVEELKHRLKESTDAENFEWNEGHFFAQTLEPSGQIWVRLSRLPAASDDSQTSLLAV